MNLFRIVLFLVAAGAAAGLAVVLAYVRETRLAGRRLSASLMRMEDAYHEFMQHRFHMDVLSNDDFNVYSDSLVSEVKPVLEPHLNALIAGINGNSRAKAKVTANDDSFQSVAATVEWINQLNSGPGNQLSLDQEQQIRASMEVAIRADLIRRKMNLQARNL